MAKASPSFNKYLLDLMTRSLLSRDDICLFLGPPTLEQVREELLAIEKDLLDG